MHQLKFVNYYTDRNFIKFSVSNQISYSRNSYQPNPIDQTVNIFNVFTVWCNFFSEQDRRFPAIILVIWSVWTVFLYINCIGHCDTTEIVSSTSQIFTIYVNLHHKFNFHMPCFSLNASWSLWFQSKNTAAQKSWACQISTSLILLVRILFDFFSKDSSKGKSVEYWLVKNTLNKVTINTCHRV